MSSFNDNDWAKRAEPFKNDPSIEPLQSSTSVHCALFSKINLKRIIRQFLVTLT